MSTARVAPPAGHHTVNPFVIVSRASEFIDFVAEVFNGRESVDLRVPDRDGLLIHAEVVIGDSSLLICDRKPDWPFTPAFLQVYVSDSPAVLGRAVEHGAEVITPVSPFYGGYSLARVRDPWHNLWWLYAPEVGGLADRDSESGSVDWHNREPSLVYTSIVQAMKDLQPPEEQSPSHLS